MARKSKPQQPASGRYRTRVLTAEDYARQGYFQERPLTAAIRQQFRRRPQVKG